MPMKKLLSGRHFSEKKTLKNLKGRKESLCILKYNKESTIIFNSENYSIKQMQV